MHRVAITGIGALTPIGNDAQSFWQALCTGISGAAPITHFDPDRFQTRFACELKGYDPLRYVKQNELRRLDPYTQYAIAAADEAIKDAGANLMPADADRASIVWATASGGVSTLEQQVSEFALSDGTPRFNPFFIPRFMVNIAAGVLAMRYGFEGLNHTVVAACASSNVAMAEAANLIRYGQADVVLTGGSEATIVKNSIAGFNALRALSTRNDDPQTACRPWDPTRDGFVMGEGAGALILEPLERALARGAHIYAEVVGAGNTCDAYHITHAHPEGKGAIRAMEQALKSAGIKPEDVQYINAHATSTPTGDLSELYAIAKVFGKRPNLAINATKSMTGHLIGAAAVIEAIACIMSLQEQRIHPTINTQTIEAQYKDHFNFVLHKAQDMPLTYAMNNSFGFGGHTTSTIYKRYIP